MNLHSFPCLILQTIAVLVLFVGIINSFPHLSGSHEHKVLKSVGRHHNVQSTTAIVTAIAVPTNSTSSSHSIRKRNAATHYFGPDPLNRNVHWWKDWWTQYVRSGPGAPSPLVSSPTSLSPSLLSHPSNIVLFDEPLDESPDESEVRTLD